MSYRKRVSDLCVAIGLDRAENSPEKCLSVELNLISGMRRKHSTALIGRRVVQVMKHKIGAGNLVYTITISRVRHTSTKLVVLRIDLSYRLSS